MANEVKRSEAEDAGFAHLFAGNRAVHAHKLKEAVGLYGLSADAFREATAEAALNRDFAALERCEDMAKLAADNVHRADPNHSATF